MKPEARFYRFSGHVARDAYKTPPARHGLRGAASMAAHNLAGVKGMSMGGAPTWRNASVTALAKAGNEPEQPDSPTPLDPNKLSSV